MKVGDKVKITIDDIEYYAIIVLKNTTTSHYGVSIFATGVVVDSDGSNLTAL